MSTNTTETDADCTITAGCNAIALIIEPRAKDLGGFSVRRCLPVCERRSIGPWVFFDEMGSAHFPAGEGVNVRPHPHINLATVTYLFTGEILHRDSLGSCQAIRPGDINLMVAGTGIVHSERERPEVNAVPHSLHGLQLWLALPEADEEIEPAFYHYPGAQIPTLEIADVPVRVLIGTAYGISSPVKTFFDTLYIEADLKTGQQLILPNAAERGLYIVNGEISLQGSVIEAQRLVVLNDADGVCITAQSPCRIALIGGASIGKRYVDWNFVSSSKSRIEQAKADWQAGKFPTVPGDDTEFIALPE